MVFSGLIFIIFIIRNEFKFIFFKEDIFIVLVLLIGLVAQLFHIQQTGIRYLTHLLFWYLSVMLFYFWTLSWIRFSKVGMDQLSVAFIVGSIIAAFGVIIDFILSNIFGFYISDVIPYAMEEMEETKNLYNIFYRPRGFSAEPGFTAVVFEMLVPLSIVYLFKKNKVYFLLFTFFIGLAYLMLTSAASFLSLALAFTLFFLIIFNLKYRFILAILLFLIYFSFFDYINLYFLDVVVVKLSDVFQGDNDRINIYLSLINLSIEKPFGIGFGALATAFFFDSFYESSPIYAAGAISLYIEVLIATGLIGLLLFIMFVLFKISRVYFVSNSSESRAILFSILLVASHHVFISEPTFPMFWVLLAIACSIKVLEKNQMI